MSKEFSADQLGLHPHPAGWSILPRVDLAGITAVIARNADGGVQAEDREDAPGWKLVDIYADEGITGTSTKKKRSSGG